MEALAMLRDESTMDGDGGLPLRVVVAVLAGLYAAALALGVLDGEPAARPGMAVLGAAGPRPAAADRVAPAPVQPGARLCFTGPGGELIELPAARQRPPAVARATDTQGAAADAAGGAGQ